LPSKQWDSEWRILVPDPLRIGHDAGFAAFTRRFLAQVADRLEGLGLDPERNVQIQRVLALEIEGRAGNLEESKAGAVMSSISKKVWSARPSFISKSKALTIRRPRKSFRHLPDQRGSRHKARRRADSPLEGTGFELVVPLRDWYRSR
jgi:hypothetical protein